MDRAPAPVLVRAAVRAAVSDLTPGALVLVAVSGGPDSMALAAALAALAPGVGLRAGVVTVDHGLAVGSADRAVAVVGWARQAGLTPAESVEVTVEGPGGVEAAARRARYAALEAAAARHAAAAVLLGHTLDDQAETVLLGLARGSGARALAGMPAVRGRLRRPLLDLPRSLTRAACAAGGLPVWDDPSNVDPAFARARVRAGALPALERDLGPGIAAALARSARLLRDDADALDAWAADVEAGPDPLAVATLAVLPRAVRTRVLRRAALAAGAPAGSLTAGHVSALEALVTNWHGQGPVSLPGRSVGFRACARLRFDACDPDRPAPGHRVGPGDRGADLGQAH